MALSYFSRKDDIPTIEKFENSLEVNEFKVWRTLVSDITAVYPNITSEWEYLSKKKGWFLVCKSDNEVLFYVVPETRSFQINFTFDEITYTAIQASNIPQPLKKHILRAELIDRGYSFFITVRDNNDIDTIKMLVQFQYDMKLQQLNDK